MRFDVRANSRTVKVLQLIARQHWIRVGLRDRILRHFVDPARVTPQPFDVPFYGYRYSGNLAQYIDWFTFFYGAYEQQELALMRDILAARASPVCLDVGANVGHHTLFLARWAATCHAFEPYDMVRRQLESKLQQNRVENVVVHAVGLGSTNELCQFNVPRDRNVGTGSFVSPSDGIASGAQTQMFEVVNGDSYLSRLAIKRVDFIKIDVEGFERQTLSGLRETIWRNHPYIFMEFSHATRRSFSDRDEFTAMFPEGYRICSVRTNEPVCFVFNRPGYRLVEFDFDNAETNLLLSPG